MTKLVNRDQNPKGDHKREHCKQKRIHGISSDQQ
jgi:hypothetical protein